MIDRESAPVPRHCHNGAVHAAHHFTRIGARDYTHYLCPGTDHDHEARCCTEHDHHTSPHKGCILR